MAKEEANRGFIKIDRKILEWEHFNEPVVLQVFLYLLIKANHKSKWHNGKMCERGATFVSIRTICEDLGMSPHTAIKALRTLENSGEVVRTQVTQKLSKTKLVNYSKYQANSLSCVAENATLSATQSATQSATKQEREERKEYIGDNNNAHTHEEIFNDLLNSPSLIQAYTKNEGITEEQFRQLAEAVSVEWSLTGEHYNTDSEAKHRILAHIRAKAQAMNLKREPVEERKKRFIDECKELIAKGCNKTNVAEFASYYLQPTADGRLLFETYRGWDTETRFLLNQKQRKAQ